MEKKIYYIFVVLVLKVLCGFCQNDSITRLDEVILSDVKVKKYVEGYKVAKLSDSVLVNNGASLTSLLRFNSTIYFRENGIGGTSSASFRGTSASQTAVIWNGININSQLNGQTDFNTINVGNYNNVIIRSGGGSVQYGSGAIGGSVHLNNDFRFAKHFENKIRAGYGNYNTSKANYKLAYGTKLLYADVGVDYINSDNDYKYLGTEFRNQNGAFSTLNLNANFGIFVSDKNLINIYHNTFLGDRNFSGSLSGSTLLSSNDNFRDSNFRNLLSWKHIATSYTSKLSVAHLHEKYRYFPNKDVDDYSFGKSDNLITKYNFLYRLNTKMQLNAITEYSYITGEGTNFGDAEDRSIFSGILIYKHSLRKNFNYTINLRQDASNVYDSPLLISLDAKYNPVSFYTFKVNASRNYRIPTYNDLYWKGAGGQGNSDLIPETSLQAEIGQEFKYRNTLLTFTGYYINSKDLIKWVPVSGIVWSPVNVDEVTSYGVETSFGYEQKMDNSNLLLQINYAYTISEDKEKNAQLIYVPFHKITASIAYTYKKFSAFYQFLYNGSVFITTDNSRDLPGYDVSNLGCTYTYFKKATTELAVNVRVNNLYNRNYQNVGFRPMPNRNFQTQLIFKF